MGKVCFHLSIGHPSLSSVICIVNNTDKKGKSFTFWGLFMKFFTKIFREFLATVKMVYATVRVAYTTVRVGYPTVNLFNDSKTGLSDS
jgi:hypothetical protein